MEHETKGRSRKASPGRRFNDSLKKALVYLVCVSLIGTSMISSSVFADVDDSDSDTGDVIVYLNNDGSVETGNNAAKSSGSGGGSHSSTVSDSITAPDVIESASNAEKVSSSTTYLDYDDGIFVAVEVPDGALPDGSQLVVERYAIGSDEFADAAEAIGHEADDENMAAVDIHFELDGEEVEPDKEVTVSIDVSEILPEEAVPASIVVTHLEEDKSEAGEAEEDEESEIAELSLTETAKKVKPVVVANKNKGEIDKENAVATFTVKDFSVFTITWDDGTGTTIEVHVYSMNGTSIDEELDVESYTSTNSVITISDLVSHLEQNASYTNTYTYRYATVVYETQQGGGYSSTTIGGQDNSVSSISKSGTTYTVTTSSGTTTVTDPAAIVIHLYYSIPEVTLATESPYGMIVGFTTSNNYFVGDTSTATYTWALSDDNLGTLVHPTSGQATFTWSDSAQSGDQVTVTVTMTVGEETASNTYTLTYGLEPVTFTVYSQDGTTPQENARVALVDASGNTVATGTTGEDGTVTLYAPAGEYTVGVTYVYLVSEAGGGSTSRATAETTITVSDDETVSGSVTLGTAITSGPGGNTSGSNGGGSEPYYYEHIDVKVAVAETSDSDVSFSDLDAVYVYDKYGNLLYVSEDINANPGTTDYNVLFDINGDEDQHSIVVSSEDTIVLVYEVVDNETGETSTYTVSYRSRDTYPADEYYPATAVNAYQLYNILYNANYTSQEAFEAAWEEDLTGYNEAGISISGYTYIQIADYLCDTRTTTGQAGLDFVIYVQELEATQDDFDFRVAKTVENVPDTLGAEDIENFTFTLQELDKVQDDGDYTEAIWSTEEGNVLSTDTDTISSFTRNSDGTWSGVLDFLGALQYEAEDGTNFYYYILSEQTPTTATPTQQYYGLKVTVTYTAATGTAAIVVSYCTLGTQDDYPYYRTSGWTGLTAYTDTDDEGEEYTYYSIPFVNTYNVTGFDLAKVNGNGEALDGAVFTMSTTQIESEGTPLYFTSETVNGTLVYTLASSTTEGASTEIAVTKGGPVSVQGMAAGTYTLTEVEAPSGYLTVGEFTLTIDIDGNVTVTDNDNVEVKTLEDPSEENPNAESQDSDVLYTVTVTDNAVPEVHKAVRDTSYEDDPFSHEDEADNNDHLEYRLEADHIAGAHALVLHDYLDDQLDIKTLEIETVILYEDADDNEGTKLAAGTDYTYTETDGICSVEGCELGCSFEISIENNDLVGLTDDAYIIVVFDIEVKEEVKDFDKSYVDEIDNFIGLSFTTTTLSTPRWVDWDETETFSYGFDLYKYTLNDDGERTPLADAEFILSRNDTGYYAKFENPVNGTYLLSEWVASEGNATPIVTGSDGNAIIEGLHEGSFTLTETAAPDGYSIINETTSVEISAEDWYAPIVSVNGAVASDKTVRIFNNTLIDVSGSKTWSDNGDSRGRRPSSITIRLYADGDEIDSKTVTANDGWAWNFTDLPKYHDHGVEIIYTISEDAVSYYTSTVNGYDVTNTYRSSNSNNNNNSSSNNNGGGVRPGTSSGPGADNVDGESGGSSSGDSSTSIHDTITSDDLGALPATGESNMSMVLMGLCAVFVILLAALFYMRRRTPREDE